MNDFFNRHALSVRQFLALPFLALMLLIGVVVTGIIIDNSAASTRQMEQRLATALSDKVALQLDHLFAEPVRAVNAVHQLVQAGKLAQADPLLQARGFAGILTSLPELSTLNFDMDDGRMVRVTRDLDDGIIHASIIASGSSPYRNVYALHEFAQHEQYLFEEESAFVPNTAQPYREAAQRKAAIWYPLYRYPASRLNEAVGNFGIGYAQPEFDDDSHLAGVVSSDLAIGQVSRALKAMPLGDGDIVMVINDTNQIVGISTDMPLMRRQIDLGGNAGSVQLLRFDNVDVPLIRAVGQHLQKDGTGTSALTLRDETYIESQAEFHAPGGLHLKTVTLIPHARFAAIGHAQLRQTLLTLWCAIAVGMALAVALAFWVGRPIAALSKWTQRIGKDLQSLPAAQNVGDLTAPADLKGAELRQLGESISALATNLHDTVTTLEERVAERTAELEQVNSNLFELSNTDGLTGIPNRRKFDEVLASEWNRATRTGQPLTLALLDVDWFKKYNDHYGHLAGDDCLRNIANVLKSKIRRSSDLVARYGGEEFAIISPGINKTNASEMANLICTAVADSKLPHAMSPFGKVTISIGVAMVVPTLDMAPETLIQAADEALYHAKDSGRNQAVSAEIEIAGKEKYAGSEFRFEQV